MKIILWVPKYKRESLVFMLIVESVESLFSYKIVEVAVRPKAIVVFSVGRPVGTGSDSPLLKSPHFVFVVIINNEKFIPYQ